MAGRGPSEFTVSVEGLRELATSPRKAGGDYPKELKVIHKDVAAVVGRRAEAIVPRRSGRLAASIRPQGAMKYGRVAAGKKLVPYAGPIHWGWKARNIEPQPFLVNALHEKQSEVLVVWQSKTDQFLDRVWKSI